MFKLRPYQKEAVEKTINYFKRSKDPALIVLPTGAGKSVVIAELAKIAKGRVLVITHVKELVEQNYEKYQSYGLAAGLYSAGLNQKDETQKAIFGSIQSIANADDLFFNNYNLLIIDECHRISDDNQSQYQTVIDKLKKRNQHLCILGLTATPYRLGLGWIYEFNSIGEIKTHEKRFFKQCIFELPISYMIKNNYLTKPIKIDIPVTCYDFSELTSKSRMYTIKEVEEILKHQKRLTPLIIKNIIDITERFNRQGVMIFASTVKHAQEILSYLPKKNSQIILGETDLAERDQIISDFKQKKFKYLVNVSVLTTGFDASHVDVIAILRPTESVSLYQQIIGRGLRLDPKKIDCFVLDYTGMGHNIYAPEVGDKRPKKESVPVLVDCPKCNFENTFWGIVDEDGNIIEHFGRKCRAASQDQQSGKIIPCGHLFRYKICPNCNHANDVSARSCNHCQIQLVDADSKLKQARLSKDAHILKPSSFELNSKVDRNGNSYLEVKYFDYDAQSVQEIHYLNNQTNFKKFEINFLRSHLRRPEINPNIKKIDDVILIQKHLRTPSFIIARKQDKFWRITEKIFSEELG
jgi:DNA repair protein RadD